MTSENVIVVEFFILLKSPVSFLEYSINISNHSTNSKKCDVMKSIATGGRKHFSIYLLVIKLGQKIYIAIDYIFRKHFP